LAPTLARPRGCLNVLAPAPDAADYRFFYQVAFRPLTNEDVVSIVGVLSGVERVDDLRSGQSTKEK